MFEAQIRLEQFKGGKKKKAGSYLKGGVGVHPKEGVEEPVILHTLDSYLQDFHTLVDFTLLHKQRQPLIQYQEMKNEAKERMEKSYILVVNALV